MSHALIIDDDISALTSLDELVAREGFTTATAASLQEARKQMAIRRPDVVLLDIVLPDGNGMDLFEDIESRTTTEVVLITGHASIETSVEALRLGAADYLVKPLNVKQLRAVLSRVARGPELKAEIHTLREELRSLGRFGRLVGVSPAMQKVYDQIARVAPTAATVLITGESGTGKEVVAQTLHDLSRRRKQVYLPVNCSAISPQLIESEMFGHERGSFTGAHQQHKGYFERAHGGTLFLDEITEMPIELQAKLLRVLETGTFMRVGSYQQLEADVRVIAATNRAPEEAVRDGKLREDLLYRLQVFPINLPPLRERCEDLDLLAEQFLAEMNRTEGTAKAFTSDALALLRKHQWPGNVRELKNIVHRAYILADDNIELSSLPAELGIERVETGPIVTLRVGTTIAEAERKLIMATLAQCQGHKERTVNMLGISLKTLYNRFREWDNRAAQTEPEEDAAVRDNGSHHHREPEYETVSKMPQQMTQAEG